MSSTQQTLEFKISNFNIVTATLGGFLSIFGLVSFLLKEKFYLGEALVSTLAGVIFGPNAADLIKPLEYARGSVENLESITLYFTRLVLGVQLVLAGIQLPARYLFTEWRSLAWLLGPGMCFMWISTSLLIWAFVPHIPFLYALAIAACVTPTDPVLSNSIVKGKFADKNIPKNLQKIIIAESGANDGLGYPFLFIALYLIRYVHDGGLGQTGGAGKALGYWFGITWGYEIILSVAYGAVVGYTFRVALHWAVDRKYVDRESYLVFAISVALFIVGTLGMLGSDDVLACFIAGNVFTWDDRFRLETADDSFQPTIDMLLNVSVFVWYGTICPWESFANNNVIPIYRLIFLGILVLLLRRLPFVLAIQKLIPELENTQQALFTGYFGPIGVSAIFYLYTSREYLREITFDGQQRSDALRLAEIFNVVVWFMVISSIIVHGLSIPAGKLGMNLPRSFSRGSSIQRSFERGHMSIIKRPYGEHRLPFTNPKNGIPTSNNESHCKTITGEDGRKLKISAPLAANPIGGRLMRATSDDHINLDLEQALRNQTREREDGHDRSIAIPSPTFTASSSRSSSRSSPEYGSLDQVVELSEVASTHHRQNNEEQYTNSPVQISVLGVAQHRAKSPARSVTFVE